jgi:hypothetical protein
MNLKMEQQKAVESGRGYDHFGSEYLLFLQFGRGLVQPLGENR